MCPGYNDGEELKRTLNDLLKYAPTMESVSVVPVGITKFRDDLPRLSLVDKAKAIETIEIIEDIQRKAMEKCNIHFAQASDEFYLIAEREMPKEDTYDGYIQLENGVGMLRLLSEEVQDAIETLQIDKEDMQKEEVISIATAILPAHSMKELVKKVEEKFPAKKINFYTIRNDFFGERITVAGLLTGVDIINQLKGKELGDRLLLSVNMFRSGEEVLLDDLTRTDIERELNVKTVIVGQSGYDLVNAIVSDNYIEENAYKAYEKGVNNE
jgi:Fe-S oxidoreductase (fragment)